MGAQGLLREHPAACPGRDLGGLSDGVRSFAIIVRAVRGLVPARSSLNLIVSIDDTPLRGTEQEAGELRLADTRL